MINRLDDYLPIAEPKTSADDGRLAVGSWPPDWKPVVAQVETWIINHPGVSLASALALGVALAWWIKRR